MKTRTYFDMNCSIHSVYFILYNVYCIRYIWYPDKMPEDKMPENMHGQNARGQNVSGQNTRK